MKVIDNDVIKKAANGDVDAFEIIYRQCSGFVFNVALRVVHTREDAEEVTQEVFVSVYRNLKSFRFDAQFNTWIYRITINTAVNFSKKLNRSRRQEVGISEMENMYASSALTDQLVEHNERNAEINKLLDQLNDGQRECLILRSVDGLSYQEIADSLKININTVRTRIKRGRIKLMELKKEVVGNEM